MKEIVIISGKGGTGKTSLAASFAMLGGDELVVADCDVDAANMHLLMQPDFALKQSFSGSKEAVVTEDDCKGCGRCREVCRFHAIVEKNGHFSVDPLTCEGCGYCARVCPTGAMKQQEKITGFYFTSTVRSGAQMVHARMEIGAENTGKLVARIKKEAAAIAARDGKEIVLVDGPPGIGCPVISSLSGASFVALVAEPTVSGIHDLKRIAGMLKPLRIKAGVIINKASLNDKQTQQIENWAKHEALCCLGKLPYDLDFTLAMTEGRTIVEWHNPLLTREVEQIWENILYQLHILTQ